MQLHIFFSFFKIKYPMRFVETYEQFNLFIFNYKKYDINTHFSRIFKHDNGQMKSNNVI